MSRDRSLTSRWGQGWFPLSLSLAGGRPSSRPVFMWSLCVSVAQSPLVTAGTCQADSGPSHMTSVYLGHLFTDPICKRSHILRNGGLAPRRRNLEVKNHSGQDTSIHTECFPSNFSGVTGAERSASHPAWHRQSAGGCCGFHSGLGAGATCSAALP